MSPCLPLAPARRAPTLPEGHLEALARAERGGDLDRELDDDRELAALLTLTRRIERRH